MIENEEQRVQKIDLLILLGDLLKVAKRMFILLLLLAFICSSGLTLYQRSNYHPIYEAYASFTVRVANPLYASATGYNSKTAEVMAATFPSIVTSGVLQKRVMEDLNVSYLPSISISATAGASIITMRVRDAEPKFAYDVLNSVITHYPEVAKFVLGPTELELLDESGIPAQPVNRFSPVNCMAKGAIAGAFLWCLIVVCMVLLRNTIHNEDELNRVLNLACMSHIPGVKISSRQACPLILREKNSFGFEESFRLLRIRVEKVMKETERKVLLVSSAIPGEGKTTVSVNLAISLAQKGNRVLLIDCDLRNPTVGKALRISGGNNLVDYLKNKITVRESIQSTVQENLYVICGGSGIQDSETVLLTQERMVRLVQAARNLFDYVILDTPPCSMVSDAAEIAELAECGLMVVRQDFAAKDQILDGIQRLSDGELTLIGCAFNGVSKGLADGYGYGYRYGYGYGDGYGNK